MSPHPSGSTATSTVTDARGRTVELHQYQAATPTGAYDSTTYTFNRKGLLSSVKDPAGNQWNYGYDLRGRQTTASAPDSGTTTSFYDDGNELVSTTDSRGLTLAYDYDVLGRRVDVRDGSSTGPLRAQWVYDTLARGHLTSSTRFVNGSAYTTTVRGYTARYDPTGVDVTIPTAEGALAGIYTFRSTYFPDGSLASTVYPSAGGLGPETLVHAYDPASGLPTTTSSPVGYVTSYVTETIYSVIGQLLRYTLQPTGGFKVWQTYAYQPGTNRLLQSFVDREATAPANLSQRTYTYDPAGNITKIADQPTNQTADVQCFSYDYLRRLTQAWTPGAGDCTVAPTAAGPGGQAPYWQQWGYDVTGNRLTQVEHATPSGDVSTAYAYPAAGAAQPHTLSSTTVTKSTGTTTSSYGYDAAGNTLSRPGPSGQQTLSWDAEGHLSSVADASGTTSFVYDAEGDRLIRRDPGGTTLYLPSTELRLSAPTGAVSATRYYTHAGLLVAMRTAAGVSWLMPDQQGTSMLAIAAGDQTAIERWQTPFGSPRGSVPSWPNEKGFVGGTVDPTGTTHLGAREYDPTIGRFISADPVIDHGDPQQVNGYAYANNSPVTMSDPSGLRLCDDDNTCQAARHPGDDPAAQPAPDQPASSPDPPANPAPKHSSGSGHWWDQAWNKAKSGFHTAVNWAEKHKAEIAGAAVSLAVGVGCTLLTSGVGAVACGVLGSALASAITYMIATPEKERSAGGLLLNVGIGAATGAVPLVGKALAPVVGAAARSAGSAIARSVARTAMAKALGAAASAASKSGAGSVARTLAESCAVNSFVAGTLVLMADGSKKPIEKVKPGDKVLAGDPQKGIKKPETVQRVIVGKGLKHLFSIAVLGAAIVATFNQPFWVPDKQSFERAQDLRPGEHLLLADGSTPPVTSVSHEDESATVYNLSISETHTFYVGADAALVHNMCAAPGASRVTLLGTKNGIEDYIAAHPGGSFDVDFMNLRGFMKNPRTGELTRGPGRWTWQRNKSYIDNGFDMARCGWCRIRMRYVMLAATHLQENSSTCRAADLAGQRKVTTGS